MEEVSRKHVQITEGGVTPKKERISKKNNQQLNWKSTVPVTIEFDELVFKNGMVFEVEANGSKPSGPIDDKTATGQEYTYTVKNDATGKYIDPKVFIDK